MKMLMIAYTEAVDEEVMELLQSRSVEGYTKWTKVLGKGKASGPHLMTHVWPKANNVLAVCVEENVAQDLTDGVRKLRETVGNEGIKAFLIPLDDVT